MTEADNLYRIHQDAQKYIAKIDSPQYHFHDGSVGRLCSLTVKSEICHQETTSSKSYWKDDLFDRALSEVIKKNFTELATEALAYMKQKADEALIAEKKGLQERLQHIEDLEKQMDVQA